MSVAAHHKAEPILPDIASRMDNDPIANESVTDHRIGADRTITADPHPAADHGICSNGSSAADFNLGTDHRTGLDRGAVFHACTDINMRSGKVTGLGQR